MSLHMELARFEWTSWSDTAPIPNAGDTYYVPKGVWVKWRRGHITDHAFEVKIVTVWYDWGFTGVWDATDHVSDGTDLRVRAVNDNVSTFQLYGLVKKD